MGVRKMKNRIVENVTKLKSPSEGLFGSSTSRKKCKGSSFFQKKIICRTVLLLFIVFNAFNSISDLFKCADFDEATTALYTVSLDMLNSLLLHTDARVLQAVANACAHLLQTDIGRSNAGMK